MGAPQTVVDRLRWLFAETLVIVIGVLIALGLDDYRTAQQERRLEIDYIQRIQDDLDQDFEYIAQIMQPRVKTKRASLELVAPVIRGQAPVPDDEFEFLKNVSLGGVLGGSTDDWYRDTTFQDMRATGNLRLIRDPAVRAEITDYYETLEYHTWRVQQRMSGYSNFVHSVIPAELREDLSLQDIERFGVDFALQRIVSDEFRILLNQEYNLMLFTESLNYEEYALSLREVLQTYRIELEGD